MSRLRLFYYEQRVRVSARRFRGQTSQLVVQRRRNAKRSVDCKKNGKLARRCGAVYQYGYRTPVGSETLKYLCFGSARKHGKSNNHRKNYPHLESSGCFISGLRPPQRKLERSGFE